MGVLENNDVHGQAQRPQLILFALAVPHLHRAGCAMKRKSCARRRTAPKRLKWEARRTEPREVRVPRRERGAPFSAVGCNGQEVRPKTGLPLAGQPGQPFTFYIAPPDG
jgi:hypothetical protein